MYLAEVIAPASSLSCSYSAAVAAAMACAAITTADAVTTDLIPAGSSSCSCYSAATVTAADAVTAVDAAANLCFYTMNCGNCHPAVPFFLCRIS